MSNRFNNLMKAENVDIEVLRAINNLISDTIYSAAWSGEDDVAPSKNAVYDAIEAAIVGGGNLAFKTITGITNDIVADLNIDTLTFTAVGGLTIVGTAGTDTITFTNTITQYTDAMVDARIVVQNTNPAGTIDIAIDALILVHKGDAAAHHAVYLDADAVSAVATADDYVKNDANDVMTGDLTVNNLITAGLVDGKDVSGLCTTAEAHAYVEANALTLTQDVIFNAGQLFDGKDVSTLCTTAEAHAYVEANALTLTQDVIFNAGQLFDGKDVSTLCTTAEAHAYVEANALTMTQDITFNAGQLFDGEDVSALAIDLANQCTTAEAHAYVEANALTMTQDITFNAGQLFDGKDVSGLCTTAEAHAYVEANALTITGGLQMSGVNITMVGAETVDGVDISALSITNMPTAINNWKVYYTNGAGIMTELAIGANTKILTSNGAAVAPSWEDAPATGFFFKTITGITNDVVADAVDDTLTFAAVGGLTIVGNAGTDTITFTNTITQYTDGMVEAIITAELVDGQSIDNAIDALVATENTIAEMNDVDLTGIVNDNILVYYNGVWYDYTPAEYADLIESSIVHNNLDGIDDGDINHLTDVQVAALHPIYTADDTAYDVTTWNANSDSPTKNVVRDLMEDKVFEDSNVFPAAPFDGQLHWDDDDEAWYRYSSTAQAWIQIGAGGGGGYVSEDDFNAANMIGSANSAWVSCEYTDSNNNARTIKASRNIMNIGATDCAVSYTSGLPMVRGGLNLHISDLLVVLNQATVNNYVTSVEVYGMDNTGGVQLHFDGTDRTAAGDYTYNFGGDEDVGAYDNINIYLDLFLTNAHSLRIVTVSLKCYYA